jgi:hypothetical protein
VWVAITGPAIRDEGFSICMDLDYLPEDERDNYVQVPGEIAGWMLSTFAKVSELRDELRNARW